MLHLFYGTDTIQVRKAASELLESCVDNGCRIERLEASALSAGLIADMAGSVSLFGEQTVYFVDTPSEDIEAYELLLSSLDSLMASLNTIVVADKSVLAPTKKRFEKVGASIREFKATETKQTFDPFLMNNALLVRDKKALWVLFNQSVQLGIPIEETVGVIWWQLKTLRLSALYPSADAAGIKSYPYDKAKRALRNFKSGEVEELSKSLLRIYHEARAGKADMVLGVEGWVLGI